MKHYKAFNNDKSLTDDITSEGLNLGSLPSIE